MYESFYGLTANPFRLVPDVRFFYASASHKRGLAYLRYGLEQGQGFVVITGKPGTGKSTLVQTLFSEMSDQSLLVASLNNTSLNEMDALHAVRLSFGIPGEYETKASLLIAIEKFLKNHASQGKRAVLIVDEAQNLPQKSLEELRMLSNFQLDDRSLIQILLLGQSQLAETLARPDMEQVNQRVIASSVLKPITAEETRAYIAHRLRCVGWKGDPAISGAALALIFAASEGIPRMINIFCDRLLLSASISEKHEIGLALAETILEELRKESASVFTNAKGGHESLIALGPLPADDFPAETSIFQKVSSMVKQKENDVSHSAELAETAHDVNSIDPPGSSTEIDSRNVQDDVAVAASDSEQMQAQKIAQTFSSDAEAPSALVEQELEAGLYELQEKKPAKGGKKGLLLLLVLIAVLLIVVAPLVFFSADLKVFFQGDWLSRLKPD